MNKYSQTEIDKVEEFDQRVDEIMHQKLGRQIFLLFAFSAVKLIIT